MKACGVHRLHVLVIQYGHPTPLACGHVAEPRWLTLTLALFSSSTSCRVLVANPNPNHTVRKGVGRNEWGLGKQVGVSHLLTTGPHGVGF